jgi:hypothetical protein
VAGTWRRTAALVGLAVGAGLTLGTGVASADDSTFAVQGDTAPGGGVSYATCPEGSHLIGGGYLADPVYTNGGSPADTLDANGPSVARQGAWAAKMRHGSATAYALCEKDDD